jgi:hypothetical protein
MNVIDFMVIPSTKSNTIHAGENSRLPQRRVMLLRRKKRTGSGAQTLFFAATLKINLSVAVVLSTPIAAARTRLYGVPPRRAWHYRRSVSGHKSQNE